MHLRPQESKISEQIAFLENDLVSIGENMNGKYATIDERLRNAENACGLNFDNYVDIICDRSSLTDYKIGAARVITTTDSIATQTSFSDGATVLFPTGDSSGAIDSSSIGRSNILWQLLYVVGAPVRAAT